MTDSSCHLQRLAGPRPAPGSSSSSDAREATLGLDSEHANPGTSVVRASDADRDRTVEALAAASAEGRLSLEEYSQRSDAALVARTLGELTSLTADLPAPPQSDAAPVPACPFGQPFSRLSYVAAAPAPA